MANANAARGLVPVRDAATSNHVNALRRYSCPSSYATALFIGDPVIKTGTADADGYSEVNLASAGGSITGVVCGFEDVASMQAGYGVASTTRAVLVDDNPATLYEIQEDAVGGALAVTGIGLNADLIAASGSTFLKTSGWMLDTSTAATTATLQVKIIEFQHRADVEVGNANSKVLVKINKHTELAGQAGI